MSVPLWHEYEEDEQRLAPKPVSSVPYLCRVRVIAAHCNSSSGLQHIFEKNWTAVCVRVHENVREHSPAGGEEGGRRLTWQWVTLVFLQAAAWPVWFCVSRSSSRFSLLHLGDLRPSLWAKRDGQGTDRLVDRKQAPVFFRVLGWVGRKVLFYWLQAWLQCRRMENVKCWLCFFVVF